MTEKAVKAMCMIDYGDESVTVLRATTHTARKDHRCGECHRSILKGEEYLVEGYVFEGRKFTHKTCSQCRVVREWLNDECGGFIYGQIAEDIREHAREGHGYAVAKMAAGINRKWQLRDGRPITISG